MNIKRDWATPLTVGAFLLMATTGILMFFHLDTGLNNEAHEWLGWVMVAGVAFHVVSNWRAFTGHLNKGVGRSLIAVFILVLALSFIPAGGDKDDGDGPPFMAPVKALAKLPISTLAVVAQTTPEQLRERLQKAGYQISSSEQSVSELVGPDTHRQVDVIARLFQPAS